jgi:CheY-like chemotaxis protein
MTYRILHVDDDPDIRTIAQLSLSLDQAFAVTSCASGDEALAASADWAPDLILCDVMMPDMDGQTVLAALRANAYTASIPVVFMTARAQMREMEDLKSLGAVAVIAKPFDPLKLASMVREHLPLEKFATAGGAFYERLCRDAATIKICRENFRRDPASSATLEKLQSCAHQLAGVAGVFDFQAVSVAASALEEAIIGHRASQCAPGNVEAALNALLECIKRE